MGAFRKLESYVWNPESIKEKNIEENNLEKWMKRKFGGKKKFKLNK